MKLFSPFALIISTFQTREFLTELFAKVEEEKKKRNKPTSTPILIVC